MSSRSTSSKGKGDFKIMDKLKKKLTEDVQKFRIKKANDSSTLETGNHNKFLT